MTDVGSPQQWHTDGVPDSASFSELRREWRSAMALDESLRRQAVELQVLADTYRHTYQWEWLGVPIIRTPEDILIMQELFWDYRPSAVVETGVARGGSLILDATLQSLVGERPKVLGIDIKIYDHTREAIANHPRSSGIELLESDSTSTESVKRTRNFLGGHDRVVLILDSNHTHAHVLAELKCLAPLLPVGSFVLVADTLIEEFPASYYANRPWDRGDNPLTAANAFLSMSDDFVRDFEWSRRGLITEFRDGVLRRER